MKARLSLRILFLCIILSILPLSALAAEADFADTTGHWAADAIEAWADYDVLKGADGQFRPDDPITRAELAAVLNRVIGYSAMSNTAFADVPSNAWYYSDVAKLYAAGIMAGDGIGTMRPEANITREEAVVLLARAFDVAENAGNENPFPDAADISGWASFLVDGMKAAHYISGDAAGNFNPKASITRAEVVTILDNMIALYVHTPDARDCEPLDALDGNALINTAGAAVKNLTISGNLWLTEGVGNGDVTLENCTVSGTTYIRGGGPNSIHIIGGSFGEIRLDADSQPALKLSKDSKVARVYLDNSASVTHDGVTVRYDAATDTVTSTFSGTIDAVTLHANRTATLHVDGMAYDVIPPVGLACEFELSAGTVIKDMTLDAGVTIRGMGKVEKATVNTDDVVIGNSVNVKPENITVAQDVDIDLGGKEYTGAGTTLPADTTPSTGGSSGGGKNNSSTTKPTQITFTAAQTGGTSHTTDSTGLVLTFSESVKGLTKDDITITNGTGAVTKGALTGSGTVWTLALESVTAQGEISVSIADFGTYEIKTATLTVEVYMVNAALAAELDKFQNVSYEADALVNAELGMSLSEPLSPGYTFALLVEENDYFRTTDDAQSFKLKKLNLLSGTLTGTFLVEVTDTALNLTGEKKIVVSLPTSSYLAALEAELAKFANISFAASDKANAELEMSLSTPLSAGYTYEIALSENDYVRAEGQKVVLKKPNETGYAITQTVTVTLTDTLRDISTSKTIKLTIPNYVYYGAKIGTLQLVGYREEDVSYNADLTTFVLAYELGVQIDTATLSAASFIIKGMDEKAAVSISNYKIKSPQVVTMNVNIIAPDGAVKDYTVTVHFVSNP